MNAALRQLSLFGAGEPTVDTAFASAQRTQLDSMSWVEHVPGWLAGGDRLLASLLSTAPWEQRERWMVNRMVIEPRLTAEYASLAAVPEAALHTAAKLLSKHYGVPYDGLWLNLYRDNQDSTSWHGDWPSCKRPICIVPVLSIGATRRFLLKPRHGGRSHIMSVADGDLVVMGGRCQRDWLHSVPKQVTPAGVRVSVNFQSSLQATPAPRSAAPGASP